MSENETTKNSKEAPQGNGAPKAIESPPQAPQTLEPPPGPAQGVSQAPAVEVEGSDLTPPIAEGFPEPTNSPIGNAAEGPRVAPAPAFGPIRSPGQIPGTPPVVHSGTGQVDKRGVVFDPLKHAVNKDGTPKPDKRGWFYSNKAGKSKAKQNVADLSGNAEAPGPQVARSPGPGSPIGPGSIDPNIPAQPWADPTAPSAEAYCQTAYALAAMYFEDEGWFPESPAEHEGMKATVQRNLRAYDIGELKPWQELLVMTSGYASKRATRPNTKEKLIVLWLRVRGWFGWKRKAEAQARADQEAAEAEKGGEG